MPLLHKTAASLLSCVPNPSWRPQKSHSLAAAVDDVHDDPKSSSSASSRSSSPTPPPTPAPPEEIELDVLTSKPAPPPTRPRLDSTLSNSTTSSSESSESCSSDFFTDSSGLTPEERRKLIEEILKELEV